MEVKEVLLLVAAQMSVDATFLETFHRVHLEESHCYSVGWFRSSGAAKLPRACSDLLLCLQAEGGKKAGAVATVVAAVDLARVRLPLADEEEAAEGEMTPQAKAITSEKRVVETKIAVAEPPPAVSVTRVQASQVREVLDSCCGHIIPVAAPLLIHSINSVDHSRF